MANLETEGLSLTAPTADPWPLDGLGDDSPLCLQADETFARQLDKARVIPTLATEKPNC